MSRELIFLQTLTIKRVMIKANNKLDGDTFCRGDEEEAGDSCRSENTEAVLNAVIVEGPPCEANIRGDIVSHLEILGKTFLVEGKVRGKNLSSNRLHGLEGQGNGILSREESSRQR